ncbi:MAG: pyrroline-5-carboxylate reductase [Acidobacteriota bacterium]
MEDLKIRRLAVIGAGKMGEALVSSLVGSGVIKAGNVVATARHRESLERFERNFGIETTLDNRQAVDSAEVILLCVKPQVAQTVIEEVNDLLGPDQVLLSIIAGLTTRMMDEQLDNNVPVVRAMPNTPSRIGSGMTAVCGGRWAKPEHVEMGRALFSRVGRSLILDEKYFDAVTGVSGSGPAFIYVVIEAMAEGGVKMGLPRNVATELAAQTCLGAAQMVIEKGAHPALLKDEVTTPAGCTVDGLLKLEEGGLRVTLIKAIVEAGRRAGELVDD